ncbi:hypothetical protein M7I_6325 [Glarea lozoyensis 74030]|uniref:Uncharacterized protein n=1 Tax=Glarea lozoyensis (strain ATCC 74030 / MF5533) TaxID=1104152 RepID=H0EU93_GLAL7|nr:hypothetical protein M7I_6325 [Glarea lozoyensis 74030]
MLPKTRPRPDNAGITVFPQDCDGKHVVAFGHLET